MQPKLALEFLNECEARFAVSEWRFRGFLIWPVVRSLIGISLWHSQSDQAKVRSFSERLSQRFSSGLTPSKDLVVRFRDPSKNQRLERADTVFLSRSAVRQKVGDYYCDVHCDPLREALDHLGKTSLHFEYAQPNSSLRYPRYKPSRLITASTVAAGVRSLLGRRRASVATSPIPDSNFVDFVESRIGRVAGLVGNRLLRRLTYIDALSEYFQRALDRAEPSVAFVVCYYTPICASFALAAARSGVPLVDIQHGVVSKHFMYDAWSALPPSGYELMPSRIWVWTEDDKAVIDGWSGVAGPQAIVGGNPWDAFWKSADSGLVAPYRARLLQLRQAHPTATHVLLSLQWDHGLTDELKQLMRQSGPNYFWWIRLHPMLLRDQAQIESWALSELGDRANVSDATSLPLPLLLASVDLHVTRHSTVIDDARRAGVPSVALEASALDKFESAATAGYMLYAESPEVAISSLEKLRATRQSFSPNPPNAGPESGASPLNQSLKTILGVN